VPSRQLTIRFYLAERRRVTDAPWPNDQFPRQNLRAAIVARAPTDDRYVNAGGYKTMGMAGSQLPAFSAWSLYKVRNDELPDEETAGAIQPLDLPADSNLAEGAHIVRFDRNIVGIYRTYEAPGRGAITRYVERVLEPSHWSLDLLPIPRPDIMGFLG